MKKKIAGFLFAFVMVISPVSVFGAEKSESPSERLVLPEKNDFNEKTNSVINFHGYEIQIPGNWLRSSTSSSDTELYFVEGTGHVAFNLSLIGSLPVDYDGLYELKDGFVDSVSGTFDNFELIETSTRDIGDSQAILFDFDGSTDEMDIVGNFLVFVDENTDNLFLYHFFNSREAEYSHFEDFYSVLDSIVYTGSESSFDESESSPNVSVEYENALESALSYLKYSAFSYSGLIDQLEYEGYSSEACAYAVDNCGADWNEQALKSAQSYLEYSAFSYSGLADQLEYEGFTSEQATYAVDNCGADWNEQAAKSAQSYLDYSSFSRQELLDQLLYEGFSNEQAEYGVTAVGY